jgi:hypothetical protein
MRHPPRSAIDLVAVSLTSLTLAGGGGGEAHSGYSLAGMITFEAIAICGGAIAAVSVCGRRER